MGLFNSYTKPGKGVDKNEPKKKGIFLFFDIIVHKFSKLLGANCMLTLTSIIWIAALFFFAALLLNQTGIVERVTAAITAADSSVTPENASNSIFLMLQLFIAMSIFVLWGSGPSSAAYAYVNRCFTRGEPVWVASDGKDKFVENFKQGMIVVIIDAVLLFLGTNAALFYHSFYASTHNIMWLLLTYIMVLMFVVYTMMHPYIYQIMVTFECSVAKIYKTALLLAVAKLPGNIFTTAVSFLVICVLYTFMDPVVASLFLGMFGLFLTRYLTDFYAARVIERTILKNMKVKNAQEPVIEYLDEEDTEE